MRPCGYEEASGQSPLHDVNDDRQAAMAAREIRLLQELRLGRATRGSAKSGKTVGGARRDRTDDLLLAKQALSQLSYGPARYQRVGRYLSSGPGNGGPG